MNDRDAILHALRHQPPEPVSLPDVPGFAAPSNLAERFEAALVAAGGTLHLLAPDEHLADLLKQWHPAARVIAATLPDLPVATCPVDAHTPNDVLATVQLAVLPGRLGVAENGAVWVAEADLGHRALPFIAEHVVLVLPADCLVGDLHRSWPGLQDHLGGYGVFIAGPSRTADIEQALVLGAHGPRSLRVVLK
jgi:L-lactate dehydrogenase complex protein LldG